MTAALEQTIADLAARCIPGGAAIDAETPLARLGLDSLAAIELAAALETELGCELPAEILAECRSVRALAARIAGACEARAGADPIELMRADAVLPPEIRPCRPVRSCTDLRHATSILVTGASGFLGAALIEELIAGTSATLLCLVRNRNRLPAHPRIQCIEGDLSAPRLGLDDATNERLANTIDAVVHCGAAVNWVFSYAGLRAANVCGTTELLRLACRAGASFHFISSVSACYAHDGPSSADESFDGLPHLRQMHLGYAQTKVVGEALVRQAGARGLPVRIYRPALISGHSRSGAYNRDDLIATLIRGCIAMRAAPDLDWSLDAVPVDVVARSILELSREDCQTFHIVHPRPRHWRQLVLWMRLCGYDVRLVSYAAWLRQLERDTRAGADHPLRPLRSFFTERPRGAGGLTLPELYEDRRRTRVAASETQARLESNGVRIPPLDAALLDRYFAAFIERGDLPAVPTDVGRVFRPGTHPGTHVGTHPVFAALESAGFPPQTLELISTGSDHSLIGELTAWRSGRPCGIFHVRQTTEDGNTRDLMVKLKATDEDLIAVGEAIAAVVDPRVAPAYRRWSRYLGFVGSHAREIAICREQDPRFLAHTPAVLATIADERSCTWLLVHEYLSDVRLLDAVNDASAWTAADVEAAVDGLASLHSIWFDREAELRAQPWIGHVPSAASVAAMSDLWMALAEHAAPCFSAWADPGLASLHQRLASTVPQWSRSLDDGPRTLIHGDFNPRNVCLRGTPPRLCAYDWELATIGAPQRDLAEFLCFVLTADTASEAPGWIERHRLALSRRIGVELDRSAWIAGFRATMAELLINRLAIYAMVHRVKPLPFLPRVVRTWQAIAAMTGCERVA